jgi:hypothetical protein
MSRWDRRYLAAGLLLGLSASPVFAQARPGVSPYSGIPRPAGPPQVNNPFLNQPIFSPYVNLLRPGSAFQNYYGFVVPQKQLEQTVGQQQQEIVNNQQAIQANAAAIQQRQEQPSGLSPTGRGAPGFGTHLRYFMNRGGGGGSVGSTGGGRMVHPGVNRFAGGGTGAGGYGR